jgi:anti-anti-sigma factor
MTTMAGFSVLSAQQSQMMHITMRPRLSIEGRAVVAVTGEIDAASAPLLSAFIARNVPRDDVVSLDLAGTTFADGALLRVLDTERLFRAPRGRIEVARSSAPVRRLLETTGQLHYLAAPGANSCIDRSMA